MPPRYMRRLRLFRRRRFCYFLEDDIATCLRLQAAEGYFIDEIVSSMMERTLLP